MQSTSTVDTALHGRLKLLLAALAGVLWAAALAMLLFAGLDGSRPPLASERLVFYALVLGAACLTFIPLQRALAMPGLAFEGIFGSALLAYTVAFVPSPTGWMLAPPDAPVYLLLAAGAFWTATAVAALPLSAIGSQLFAQRARRFDVRRAHRQAHQVGALAALTIGLAGLRQLSPLSFALVGVALILTETVFLSLVEAET